MNQLRTQRTAKKKAEPKEPIGFTYIGWLMHRTWGGLMAGLLFVLPGFISIFALSILYAGYNDLTLVQGLFYGLKPAVVAVVFEAVIRIGKRSLKNRMMVGIAVAAFVAIFFLQVPFPILILVAGICGLVGGKFVPDSFVVIKEHKVDEQNIDSRILDDAQSDTVRPKIRTTLSTIAIWLAIWLAPVIGLYWFGGAKNIYTQEAVFFSKTSLVTFGGAYSVLAYVAEESVNTHHWLKPGEMVDGLGMAETTPGPLIQVVQFVGFMGAFRAPGELHPMLAGFLGSIITTWVTFAPCFLWIFAGAPYIEYLRGQKLLSAALSTITAAVVGVVLNLSIWFSLHSIFAVVNESHAWGIRMLNPDWSTMDPVLLVISITAFVAIFRFKTGMILTLLVSALIGLVVYVVCVS